MLLVLHDAGNICRSGRQAHLQGLEAGLGFVIMLGAHVHCDM